jgi:hypothetical protein
MLATTPAHTQRLHHAFDRSVTDLRRAVDSLSDSDRRRAQAIATWFDGFSVELRAHLQSVAELVIPTIARRHEQQADDLAERVADHHCSVDEAIDDLSVALARLASRVQPWAFNHDRAIDAVHRLEAAAHRSNAVEADKVLPVMAHLHPSELYDIELRTAALTPVRHAAFACPWLVSSLHPGERDHVLAAAPRPMRIMWSLSQRRYARLVEAAFGPATRRHLAVVPDLPTIAPLPLPEPADRSLHLVTA